MTLRRLTLLGFAFCAASCAAACAIVVAFLAFSRTQVPFGLDLEILRFAAFLVALVALFIALLVLIPFLIAMIYAERHAIRSLRWYVTAGAATGLVALGTNLVLTAAEGGLRLSDLSEHPLFATIAGMTTIVVLAGMCAGYTFWLIAGRNTGRQEREELHE